MLCITIDWQCILFVVNKRKKKQAVELLEGLGLNLSDAVNMFLRQVILQKGIPFEVKNSMDAKYKDRPLSGNYRGIENVTYNRIGY